MRTAKTLIRLGGCLGWSESSLGAHSFCWFCHVVAHLCIQQRLRSVCPSLQSYLHWTLYGQPQTQLFFMQTSKAGQTLQVQSLIWMFAVGTSVASLSYKMNLRTAKATKLSVCSAKTQISLGIRPVWSEISLPAWRTLSPWLSLELTA